MRVNAGGTGLEYVAGGAAFTAEDAQDAVGAILVDTATIDLTYTDATPSITAAIVAGSVNTTQLANDAVTYAKLQNVTDARLLGRSAGSAGDAQELTVAGQLSLSGGVLTGTGQPLDATLTTIAALVGAADRMIHFTGTDVAALNVITALARTLLAGATTAAMQSTLGLGTAATQTYTTGSFTVTATGFSGTAPSGTAEYVQVGKQVTLLLPELGGTSNVASFTLTGIPAALAARSAYARVPVQVINNGVHQVGLLLTTGTAWLVLTAASLELDATGPKQVFGALVTYLTV